MIGVVPECEPYRNSWCRIKVALAETVKPIRIGAFEVDVSNNPRKILIHHVADNNHEGGEFSIKKLESVIKSFYDENF
jgi:hypothetical protein